MKMWQILLLAITTLATVQGAPPAFAYSSDTLSDKYLEVNRANLAKLYWHLDKMDINSDTDIDNFIMLNRCDLYQKYYHNDFVWHDLRSKARVSLAKNKSKFSPYIRIIKPIYLGRYNPQMETFDLQEAIETNNFEIRAHDEITWECYEFSDRKKEIWRYPHRAALELSTPIKMDKVPVPAIVAYQYNTLFSEEDLKKMRYRPAYMVQDIKVFSADPFNNKFNKGGLGTLSAVLESIHIYGDQELDMLLYTQTIR